jgi:hypothetical protein
MTNTTDFHVTKPIRVEIGLAGSRDFRTLIQAVDYLIGLGCELNTETVEAATISAHGMRHRITNYGVPVPARKIGPIWYVRAKYWIDHKNPGTGAEVPC